MPKQKKDFNNKHCKYCNKLIEPQDNYVAYMDDTYSHTGCDKLQYFQTIKITTQKEIHGK